MRIPPTTSKGFNKEEVMAEQSVEELGQEVVRKLNGLAAQAMRGAVVGKPSNPSSRLFYRRRLARYFMRANYTVVLERIEAGSYPEGFLREKLDQMGDMAVSRESLSRAIESNTLADSVYDVASFYR
jgi:hypothetical protein